MPLHDQVICGDSREVLTTLPDGCCDALVSDPPAAIGMMNMQWDHNRGGRDQWIAWLAGIMAEARRCVRPGGYALVWALPRTSHWTATAMEDANWRVVDVVTHVQSQGFPKSRSLLKPSSEHWILCRAPGPRQELNIDACRVPTGENRGRPRGSFPFSDDAWGNGHLAHTEGHSGGRWPSNVALSHVPPAPDGTGGCRPAGVRRVRAHWSQPTCGSLERSMFNLGDQQHGQPVGYADADGYETVDAYHCVENCPVRLLDGQAGPRTSGVKKPHHRRHAAKGWSGPYADDQGGPAFRSLTGGDTGACSRFFTVFPPETPDPEDAVPFFYAPKAPRSERRLADGTPTGHPTQKPLSLARWLSRLICPPSGVILDPFAGVCSLGCGAILEGFGYIGIEMSEEYCAIGRARLEQATRQAARQLPLPADASLGACDRTDTGR